jgi:hypothetical protein
VDSVVGEAQSDCLWILPVRQTLRAQPPQKGQAAHRAVWVQTLDWRTANQATQSGWLIARQARVDQPS